MDGKERKKERVKNESIGIEWDKKARKLESLIHDRNCHPFYLSIDDSALHKISRSREFQFLEIVICLAGLLSRLCKLILIAANYPDTPRRNFSQLQSLKIRC